MKRIQITMSETLLNKVDKYAEDFGVTRSAFCTNLIGQGVMGIEKGIELVQNNLELFAKEAIK